MKKSQGGKRAGAGRPKGSVSIETLDKQAQREFVRHRVAAALGELVDSQIANAKGIKYLVVRQKSSGKFLRIGEMRAGKHNPDEEIIEVWEKDPSVQAFTDLLNRAIDKPAEQMQEIKVTGEINIVERLQAARKRLANRTHE